MAELLIRVADSHVSRGYHAGDVVVVMPDDHTWGVEESRAPDDGGRFIVIAVPGVSVKEFESLLEPRLSATETRPQTVMDADGKQLTRLVPLETARRDVPTDLKLMAPARLRQAKSTGWTALDKEELQAIVSKPLEAEAPGMFARFGAWARGLFG